MRLVFCRLWVCDGFGEESGLIFWKDSGIFEGIVCLVFFLSEKGMMKMRNFLLISVLFVFAAGVVFAGDGDGKAKEQKDEKKEELKLKDLFPEKSLFGPSAYYMAFSEDGRYGAYLYKTYKERRHGNDLFIYDTETGRVKRITWPSVMQEFQKSSRKVVEDRKEKAEKDKPKKDADKKDEGKDKECPPGHCSV